MKFKRPRTQATKRPSRRSFPINTVAESSLIHPGTSAQLQTLCAKRKLHSNFYHNSFKKDKTRHMLHKRKYKIKHTIMTENRDRQQQSQGEFGDDFTIPLRGELSSEPDGDEGELSLSSLTIRPRRRRNGRRGANRPSRRTLRSTGASNDSMSSFGSSTSSGSSRISFECDAGDILLAISASSGLDLLDAEEEEDDDNNDTNTNNDDASSTSQTSNPQTPRTIPRRGMQHYRRQMSTSMTSLLEVDDDDDGDNDGADAARPVVSRLDLAIMRHNGVMGSRWRHRASRRNDVA